MHVCVHMWVYMHTYNIHNTHRHTYRQPTQSCFGDDVHIGSGLISLHWTTNKDAHAWEGLSLLLSTVNSFLTFFCLRVGTHEIICLYLHWCCDSFNFFSTAISRTVCFIADFLIFWPLNSAPFSTMFPEAQMQGCDVELSIMARLCDCFA